MLRARRLLHNAGGWSVLRIVLVTVVIIAVAIRTLVVEESPWPLVGCIVAILAVGLLRERMIEHLASSLAALRVLGVAILVLAGSSPLWFPWLEKQPTISAPLFTGFVMIVMAYAASYVAVLADHRVERE